jgi:hypothetical protein
MKLKYDFIRIRVTGNPQEYYDYEITHAADAYNGSDFILQKAILKQQWQALPINKKAPLCFSYSRETLIQLIQSTIDSNYNRPPNTDFLRAYQEWKKEHYDENEQSD